MPDFDWERLQKGWNNYSQGSPPYLKPIDLAGAFVGTVYLALTTGIAEVIVTAFDNIVLLPIRGAVSFAVSLINAVFLGDDITVVKLVKSVTTLPGAISGSEGPFGGYLTGAADVVGTLQETTQSVGSGVAPLASTAFQTAADFVSAGPFSLLIGLVIVLGLAYALTKSGDLLWG